MLNLNYNLNSTNVERAVFTEQENEAFRPFQIQYVIVPAGGGAAGGNNSFNSGSDIPKIGIAGNGGVIASGSYCVQPLTAYPVIIGKGGAGGIKGITTSFTGSNGGDSSFYNIIAFGGEGGKSQIYITSSTAAGSGASTSASIANGGSGSQWTYNLPGCLPDPFNPGCHGGQLISESYYSGGGAGINVSGSVNAFTIEYVVVGGGGGGASYASTIFDSTAWAAGGGGGGVVSGSFVVEPIVRTYPIVVGAGGSKASSPSGIGGNGQSSSAFGSSASGGTGGGFRVQPGGSGNNGDGGNSGTGSWGNTTQYIGGQGLAAGGGGAAGTGSIGTSDPSPRRGGNGGNGLPWVNGMTFGGGGYGLWFQGGDGPYQGNNGANSLLQFNNTNIGNIDFLTYPGLGGYGGRGNQPSTIAGIAGFSGSVIIRYPGTEQKATGGTVFTSASYTYHVFTSSANFQLNQVPENIFTSGLAGIGAPNSLFSVSGSLVPTANTGGGAPAAFYNQNGVSGSDGFVAIRYEGAPLATGGNIVVTDFYTYHLFSSSGDFYVIGQESDPNINPCP